MLSSSTSTSFVLTNVSKAASLPNFSRTAASTVARSHGLKASASRQQKLVRGPRSVSVRPGEKKALRGESELGYSSETSTSFSCSLGPRCFWQKLAISYTHQIREK